MMLAAVAFQFTIMEELPRVGFLTRLDRFLLACFLLLFTQAAGVGVVYVLTVRSPALGAARALDFALIGTLACAFGVVSVVTLRPPRAIFPGGMMAKTGG